AGYCVTAVVRAGVGVEALAGVRGREGRRIVGAVGRIGESTLRLRRIGRVWLRVVATGEAARSARAIDLEPISLVTASVRISRNTSGAALSNSLCSASTPPSSPQPSRPLLCTPSGNEVWGGYR